MTGQATDTRRYPWLRRPLFWVIVVFLLLVLLVALVVAVYNRAAQEKKAQMDRQHEAIESFVAPVGWEEVSAGHSSGHFSKHPCLILSLCDRYHAKHYVVSEPPAGADLRAIAEAAGWEEIRFVADPQHPNACREDGEGSNWCPLRAVSGRVELVLHTHINFDNNDYWTVDLSVH